MLVSERVEPDTVLVLFKSDGETPGSFIMNALTLKNILPVPLWTRHMLGVAEAERDRRKYKPREITYRTS